MNLPVFDLHCDLLSYLEKIPGADPMHTEEIGCALPHLAAGNVQFQVMAIWNATGPDSITGLKKQVEIFLELEHSYPDRLKIIRSRQDLDELVQGQTGMMVAVENASGLSGESGNRDQALETLDWMASMGANPLYLSLTHHTENRFGGGNLTAAGLSPDGEWLVRALEGRSVALDFAHTSDALAADLLSLLDRENLDIPVLASHSNFRAVWDHHRNLTDEVATAIARRNGVVGVTFIRDFVDEEKPDTLYQHMIYGYDLTGGRIALGGDFFPTETLKDVMGDRHPIFHLEHENASCYPDILAKASLKVDPQALTQIAWKQAEAFIRRLLPGT